MKKTASKRPSDLTSFVFCSAASAVSLRVSVTSVAAMRSSSGCVDLGVRQPATNAPAAASNVNRTFRPDRGALALARVLQLVATNLARRKGRAFATALGIALGVATIVALLSVGAGLRRTAGELVHLGQADVGVFQSGVNDPTASLLPLSVGRRLDARSDVEAATPLLLVIEGVKRDPASVVFGADPERLFRPPARGHRRAPRARRRPGGGRRPPGPGVAAAARRHAADQGAAVHRFGDLAHRRVLRGRGRGDQSARGAEAHEPPGRGDDVCRSARDRRPPRRGGQGDPQRVPRDAGDRHRRRRRARRRQRRARAQDGLDRRRARPDPRRARCLQHDGDGGARAPARVRAAQRRSAGGARGSASSCSPRASR